MSTYNTVTIYWNNSTLVYGPENYEVHYGINILNLVSDTVSQPGVELTGLQSNSSYYYVVIASNTAGSIISEVNTFITSCQKCGKIV